ncbi:suppressor of fused domain protein [Frankia sp. AgB1.9]|uniref:suppressor of fused domain protein n=1 Tax=unclassified Frankia TaxID=2632575 RepID=UPI0019321194|nr:MULTISPECIES: suppressor of fused domain protein [unclassified Frankia]MBL7492697.1 suppressor of fused domain protein [Frankia sp. AgW1.1]MBL7549687.1 suppressor of fused domain protein [Frankia sp. AgB1.9]MBL7623144.1 suppressor of fused domain protein [Frankia sp. AgB1.8]
MDVRAAVERHLVATFGPITGRAGVTFLGADPIDVLRFGPQPDGFFRYATVGMSAEPMSDPTAAVRDPAGPRAELVLSLRTPRDSVVRRLAVLAAIPAIEGVPVVAGSGLDLGEPLWDDARFHAVLVGEPGGLVPDLPTTDLTGPASSTRPASSTGPSGLANPAGSGSPAGLADPGESGGPASPDDPGASAGEPASVRFLPLFPMTPNESAFKRVHGAGALRERWLADELDLRDPTRREARLT